VQPPVCSRFAVAPAGAEGELRWPATIMGASMTSLNRLWLALALIASVLLLPLILPAAFVLHAIYLQRLRSAAAWFVCTCGQVLGRGSLRLGDIEWARRMEEMRIKYPEIAFRLVRDVHAICSKCGKEYGSGSEQGTLKKCPYPRMCNACVGDGKPTLNLTRAGITRPRASVA
jgi:hypothetical protein